jgi:glycerol-3-phosphate acyltransferase PlsY
MWTIESILAIGAAYMWGSVSPSYIVTRWIKGIDLRQYGSANVGASNAGEQLGRAWMIGTGSLDFLKGMLPTALSQIAGFDLLTVVLVGLATEIGHDWSMFLGWRGGRGVSVMVSLLFVWDLRVAFALLVLIGAGAIFKQSALFSAIALLLIAPIVSWLGNPIEIILACLGITLIAFIKRLEANHLPLPQNAQEKRTVLWRRFWLDRDVSQKQNWEKRKQID